MSGETQDRFKSMSLDETKGMIKEGASSTEAYLDMVRILDGGGRPPKLSHVAALVQRWQSATFGPPEARTGCTARLEHLRREVLEAIESSDALDEWGRRGDDSDPDPHEDGLASELADIGILLLSACDEAGFDLGVIMYRKLIENRARTWGKPDADGVIEHDRGGS